MIFIERYLNKISEISEKIDSQCINDVIEIIDSTRNNKGRLFLIGVGGGAGHASHAVNDFRKIVGIESYSPSDNVSELTARINDEGWDTCYSEWLKTSNLNSKDMILIFSVGGGNVSHNLSMNIVKCLELAKDVGCKICGIVGRDGGETKKYADSCIVVPDVDTELTTVLTESYQAIIWHLIVSHPKLYNNKMKWESVEEVIVNEY